MIGLRPRDETETRTHEDETGTNYLTRSRPRPQNVLSRPSHPWFKRFHSAMRVQWRSVVSREMNRADDKIHSVEAHSLLLWVRQA